MAEAVEHEPQVEPAAPVAAGAGPAVAVAAATSDLAGAGQSRPSLSRALVMRLQGSAGNAAVSGLVAGGPAGPTEIERRPGRGPTEADSQVMAAIVARAPTALDPAPVVRSELDVPMETRVKEPGTNPFGPAASGLDAAAEGARGAANGPGSNPLGPAAGGMDAAAEGARGAASGPGSNPLGPAAGGMDAAAEGARGAANGPGTNPFGAAASATEAATSGAAGAIASSATGAASGGAPGGTMASLLDAVAGGAAGAGVASGLAAATGGGAAGAVVGGLDGAAAGGAAGAGALAGVAGGAAAAGGLEGAAAAGGLAGGAAAAGGLEVRRLRAGLRVARRRVGGLEGAAAAGGLAGGAAAAGGLEGAAAAGGLAGGAAAGGLEAAAAAGGLAGGAAAAGGLEGAAAAGGLAGGAAAAGGLEAAAAAGGLEPAAAASGLAGGAAAAGGLEPAAAASGLAGAGGAATGATGAETTSVDAGAAGATPTAAATGAAGAAGATAPAATDAVGAAAAGASGPAAADPAAAGAAGGAAGATGPAPADAAAAAAAGGGGAAVAAAGGLADALAGGGAGGAAGAGAQIGGAITAAMGNVGPALDGAAVAGGPNAAPAAGAVGGAPDVAGGAAGPESEGGATQEGPSEDELAALESQLNAGPKAAEPEHEPEAAGTEGENGPEAETASAGSAEGAETGAAKGIGAPTTEDAAPDESGGLLSRAPADTLTAPPSGEMQNQLDGIESEQEEAEQQEEAPADDASISADAQGELADLGASGGDDMAAAGGGGGGGGGGAVEAQPEPPAPDVSNADPAQAVQAAASLKPAQMLETLGGAEKAASNHVEKEHQKLQAEPPSITAGGGTDSPAADERFTSTAPNRPTTTKAAEKTGGAPEKPAPTPAPPPKAPLPPAPAVAGDEKGNVGADGAAKIQQSIAALPTADGAVAVPSISAPKVALTGAADPTQINEQKQHLDQTVAKASAQGAQEAHEPAGEDHLAPTTKAEKIQAEITGGAPAGGAAATAGPGTDDDTASIVADQESGPALKAQIAQASGQINQEKSQHQAKSAQDKAAALEQAAAEETKGKADQLAEHAAAKAGVSQARSDWTSEQKQQADAAKTEATGHMTEAQTAINSEKLRADAEASKHVEAGLKEANDAKAKGDEDARKEKEKAKEESSGGGFFGWVASKAKALYNKVKDGITNIFNKVRSAITTAINKAKDLAHSVIEKAVKFVADKVKAVAGKLLAIGDRLIPGFATLRQKFKTWIVNRVKQAVAALNRIVTAVKDGIRRVMTAVGNALKQGLDLLKKGISAAINAVKNAVKAAIEKAKAMIATLAQFAVIIKDVAANPGAWIRNLGAAIMDGIKNHLWAALKQAISQWFNDKVESLLGLGKSVWNLLTKGGITMAQVGKMAWEAIKSAIPAALIAILVERLVSMIVPAAGAVMAIIQGLVAAWGAIQRILAAIDRFIAFLKAVKSGNAGPAFAQALAAAAVAVIEFVSQFLLRKIAGAASKVAGKIKAIAQKIGKRLMAAFKKVGKAVKKGWNKLKAKAKKAKEKIFGPKKQKSPEDEAKQKQERLDKAVAALRPKISALMAKGTTGVFLKARLLAWRVLYRLSKLEAKKSGENVEIIATVNPFAPVGQGTELTGDRLRQLAHLVAEKLLQREDVLAAAERMRKNWEERPGTPTEIEPGEGYLGATKAQQNRPPQDWGHKEHYTSGENRHAIGEQQFTGATNQFVDDIGAYPEIAKKIGTSGMTDARFALIIRSYAATGKLPEGLSQEHGDMVAKLSYLMFVRESHRNQGNASMGPMTLDLIRSGNMTFHEAFAAFEPETEGGKPTKPMGRGAYPMSGVGAPAAERGLAWEEDRPMIGKSKGKVENRRELQRREIELVSRWIQTQFAAEGGAIAASESAIADKIEKMVLGFYKMK